MYLIGTTLREAYATTGGRMSSNGYFYLEMEETSASTYEQSEDIEAAPEPTPLSVAEQPERLLFMRKVFASLGFQYLLTFGAVSLCVLNERVRDWLLLSAPVWLIYVVLFVGIAAIFPVYIFADTWPLNIMAVTAFVRSVCFFSETRMFLCVSR